MKHLKRAGGLLFALLILIIVLKFMPASEELQSYGFYRDTENTQEWASQALQYADPNSCGTCHADKNTLWVKSAHAPVSCENCHGPAEVHSRTGAKLVVDPSQGTCTVCHAKLDARPATFPQVDVKTHAGTAQCASCHNPHSPSI